MWDPSGYQDTDYGLEAEERFEPSNGSEWDNPDTSLPHIRTILGPIPPDALGMCLPFEHLAANDSPPELGASHLMPARDTQIVSELEMYFMSGGRSIVNVAPNVSGQSVHRLQTIARRVPVHILSAHTIGGETPARSQATGRPDHLSTLEIPDWAGLLMVGDASISSGLGLADLADSVADTQRSSGLPLVIRSELPNGGIDLASQLGISAERPDAIILTLPPSLVGQWSILLELANLGMWIGFEGLGLHGEEFDALAATQCAKLMQAGYTDRLLLSPGLFEPSQFVSQGGAPGWTYLLEHFSLALMAAGAEATAIRDVLIENPSKALTVQPVATQ